MSGPYVVFDPWEADYYECATFEEAMEKAENLTQSFLMDGTWDEDVEGVFVAKVVAAPVKRVLARNGDPGWDEITGGSDSDEWWDYELVIADADADIIRLLRDEIEQLRALITTHETEETQ